ncbi:MAG: PLP-dependent aminotransferase family protein [Lentisphaerae bacterium]|nr:PLP-dependent aminotransferase family protein [Lentisphaerota bacterium]
MEYNKMPTNSFEHFYLSWTPDKSRIKRPYYLALANALEADIVSGKLSSGTKLPPQRELADYLDLNFTTVTQAYNLCRERNLIYGVTGRGTFVAAMPGNNYSRKISQTQDVIELGLLRGFDRIKAPIIEASKNVLTKGYIEELYSYTDAAGHLHQRAAGAHWMKQMDVCTDSEHTAIFSGAQNIISAAMLSLFKIGDKIAIDEYTYSNLLGTAHLSHIRLIPVRGDADGMMPDELEYRCKKDGINGIFLMPNCANPTTCTIPENRKDELSEVIARYGLILIEDDNTGIPQTGAGNYHSMFFRLPEQTIYICNSTMALCNGLRVAFAAFPENFRVPLLNALFHLNIKTSSLDAEIMTELILSGKAAKILEQKAELACERNRIFDRYFPEAAKPGTPAAFFRWLPLPEMTMDEMEIEHQLLLRKVSVYCSYRFTVTRGPYSFMRLAISSPPDTTQLEKGCSIIRDFIKENQSDATDSRKTF